MCGINGVITSKSMNMSSLLSVMNNSITHRGPDFVDLYSNDSVGLGHVRLSILDLSSHANQPFTDKAKDCFLSYNGEVYNFDELKKKYNFTCLTTSDTEVIFHGLKKFGKQFVSELNGMFSLAFYDKRTEEVLVARDRIGIKPLYFYNHNDVIAFSSELKGLKSVKDELGGFTMDQDAISAFLYLGYIPQPLTIYKEIKKFPSGTLATIKNGEIHYEKYWDVNTKISSEIFSNEKAAKKELKRLVNSSVELRLKSDVPFGTFLSGGIDSSLVSAVAQDLTKQQLKTFSIGFDNPKYNEAQYAKEVANYIKSDHHEFRVTENEAKYLVDDLIKHYDEPFGDPSSIPTMMVSKLARKHVKMTLSGDGGDEVFHGYGFYNWANRLSKPLVKNFRKIIGTSLGMGNNRMKRAAHLFDYPRGKMKSHIFSQEQYFFSLKELDSILVNPGKHPDFIEGHGDKFNRVLSPKEEQSLFDIKYYLRDDLLNKVDMASMKFSLETRVPLLDHRIIEFGLNLDENLKIKNGDQKHLLKKVLYDYIPELYFNRPKKGFNIPLQSWLETDLSYLIDNNLSKENIESAGLAHFEEVDKLLNRFRSGEGYLFTRVWALVILHEWFRNN